MSRRRDAGRLAVVVGVLAVYVVVRSTVLPGAVHTVANTAMIGVLAGLARWSGLGRDELGLAREHAGRGLRVGLIVAAVVGAATLVAAVVVQIVGESVGFVEDRRDLGALTLLVRVLLVIPVATVVVEELAFRGVIAALAHRLFGPWRAVLLTSALFGLWHVPGAWGTSEIDGLPTSVATTVTLVATVAFTGAAGVVLQLMRDRTDSLLAPSITHWATNGLTLAIVWVVAALAA